MLRVSLRRRISSPRRCGRNLGWSPTTFLFFMHLATRRVLIAGITPYPDDPWMTQMTRNVTTADVGFLCSTRYLIHDRDSKYCASFKLTIQAVGIKTVKLPARSPDLNSFAERWVKSVKDECLLNLILFGERSLRLALKHYVTHHHHERNHQGKENLLLFPAVEHTHPPKARFVVGKGSVDCSDTTTGKPHEFFDHTGLASGSCAPTTRFVMASQADNMPVSKAVCRTPSRSIG